MEILHVSSTTTVAGRSSESTNSPFQTWITHGYRRHRSFKLLPYHTWKTNSWNIFWKETLSKRHLLVQFWFSGVYVERSCLFKKAHCSVFTLCTYSFMPCISRFPKKGPGFIPPHAPSLDWSRKYQTCCWSLNKQKNIKTKYIQYRTYIIFSYQFSCWTHEKTDR